MTHLEDSQLVEAYYGEQDSSTRTHLAECEQCRAEFERLKDSLASLSEYPAPARDETYGAEVWARLAPQLPPARPRAQRMRSWLILAPAAAALIAIAFVGGMLTQQRRQTVLPAKVRERVLLMAISAHLDRSQIVFAELLHADTAGADFANERERARDLVSENRLLRESASRAGDQVDANLLGELEPVLIEIANSPSTLRPAELRSMQQRVEEGGWLFKVRVSGEDTREKGQRL